MIAPRVFGSTLTHVANFAAVALNTRWQNRHLEWGMDRLDSKRATLVEYAKIFGVEISPEDAQLEASVDDLIGFIADIDALGLEGMTPASNYDPSWPRINETCS